MFRHQALDFAKILSRKAYATRNSSIMQPHFSGSRALVDMNVRWLVGLMTVKVEPKPIQSQYRGHLCAPSMTSEVREERGGSWVESRKLSQVCQLKWVSLLFYDFANPAPAVLEALAADGIAPAQKGTAHAPVDHVVPGCVGQRDEGGAGAGHGWSLENWGKCVN